MRSLTICLMSLTLLFASCREEDRVVAETSLPVAARDFLSTHFPTTEVNKVVRDRDDREVTYEVFLQNGIEVEFSESGQATSIDGRRTQRLPESVVPAALLAYVETHYSDHFVVEWDIDRNDQEIRLSNGVELVFDLNGKFIRIDH